MKVYGLVRADVKPGVLLSVHPTKQKAQEAQDQYVAILIALGQPPLSIDALCVVEMNMINT